MTKERRTVTLSKELDEVIAFLASAKQMNLSEFLETRLRMLPEIQKQVEIFQNLPEDPIIDIKKVEKEIGRKIPKHLIFSKSAAKRTGKASYYPTVSREEEVLTYLLTRKAVNMKSATKIDRDPTLGRLIKAGHVGEKRGKFFLTNMGQIVANGATSLYPELKK